MSKVQTQTILLQLSIKKTQKMCEKKILIVNIISIQEVKIGN